MNIVPNFPKTYKFGVGDRMIELNINMLEQIFVANASEDKQPAIEKFIAHLGLLNMLLRLCHRMHVVNDGQYAALIKHTVNLGKQAAGWKRKTARVCSATA